MLPTFQGHALGGKVICLLTPTLAPLLRLWGIWNITIVIFYILVLALYLLKIYMS